MAQILKLITSVALATITAVASAAPATPQGQAPAPQGQGGAQAQNTPQQPKSGLGKQAASGKDAVADEIKMPKPGEVVEQAIDDIEATQLNDAQYERLKQIYIRRERQKAMPYVAPAKPVTRTLAVNLDPGVSPPVLRLARGQLTSIVFSDISGQPWMIKDVRIPRELFSDGRREGEQGAQEESNVLSLEPLSASGYGNATIKLKGLPTPVIFVLTTAQQEVDLRIDAKVPGHNPDAIDSVSFTSMPNIDVSLTAFLDGVPPKDAKRLQVTGLAGTEAWVYRDNLYVRADAEVQYPAYMSAARSTSGKAVYRFNSRQNSVTLLANGRAITVFIED